MARIFKFTLKGLISDRDRFVLFSRASFLNVSNLNKIICEKEDKYFNILIELVFDKKDASVHINKFKSMGWVVKR